MSGWLVPTVEDAPGTDDVPGDSPVVGQDENDGANGDIFDDGTDAKNGLGQNEPEFKNQGKQSSVYGGTSPELHGGTNTEDHGGTSSKNDGGTLSKIVGGTSLLSSILRASQRAGKGSWLEKYSSGENKYYRWRWWLYRNDPERGSKKANGYYVAPVKPKRKSKEIDYDTQKRIEEQEQKRAGKRRAGKRRAAKPR